MPPLTIALIAWWIGGHVWLWRATESVVGDVHAHVALITGQTRRALEQFVTAPSAVGFEQGVLPSLCYSGFHSGVVAVLFNVVFLWVFGGRLESRAGTLRFGLFAVIAVLAGAVGHMFGEDPSRLRFAVGGGALTAAAIVAYLVLHPRSRMKLVVPVVVVPIVTAAPAIVITMAWLAAQYEPVRRFLTIGEAAPLHYLGLAAGGVAGLLACPLLMMQRARKPEPKPGQKPRRKPA
ncbi:MAG: rhomboid family intramembrane serine protease [Planctomycetes bacterium]|nr:rhomboid family intramembrane serine protease [Planctomycetota bacterium]